jgi:hypothetical protein
MSVIRVTEEGIEIDGVLLKDTVDFKAFIDSHQPAEMSADITIHQPYPLDVLLEPIRRGVVHGVISPLLSVRINNTLPSYLAVSVDPNEPSSLYAYINPMYASSFLTRFRAIKQRIESIRVFLKVNRTAVLDLQFLMHIWCIESFRVDIDLSDPYRLLVPLWAWAPSDITVAIASTHPPPLQVGVFPQPEPGTDLLVTYGFYLFSNLRVDFGIWTEMYNLQAIIHGFYLSALEVELRMGSYSPLTIDLPGTSGYKGFYVTCKPASRMMTTIIPVYTIECKNLYVSINQGWPCGFGSTYKLLSVTFDSAYFLAFTTTFKVIDGSDTGMFAVFINRAYFDTYINRFDIHINIPKELSAPETRIFDQVGVVYDNEFADLYQDIMQITFSWPRIRLWSGAMDFSVELLAYRGDKLYELSVEIFAQRQDPVRQPTSRPIMPKEDAADPIWPDVFQVQEIELWGDDPPEVVRKIEIKFEEQIHEYFWISSEQRAVSKRVWEQWSFLTRGYLPSTEYGGQIDYLTMRTLSAMNFYDTIDQAVKAMISSFLYGGKSSLNVTCSPHGGYNSLLINMNIWDSGMLKVLKVQIEPMHTQPLAINLTAI